MTLSWHQLVALTDVELGRLDIAEVELTCALGLPGSDRIDVGYCLRTLDAWTDTARRYADLAHAQFFLTNPAEFDNSEPLFRMICLATVLQRHCGVRYNPAKSNIAREVPFDFEDEFIHGVIQGPGGTCANLPVVIAAVGRRLGYPIRLVHTKQHQFCRWQDSSVGPHVNIEWSVRGINSFPDSEYRQWPLPISAEEEKKFGFLESLTPRRELASFVAKRGFRLKDACRYREAIDCFLHSDGLDRHHAVYSTCALQLVAEWKRHLQSRYPPAFPRHIAVSLRKDKPRWPSIPWEVEREIACLHAIEWCLDHPRHVEWWWEPLRQGRQPLYEVPTSIEVNYEAMADL